MQRTFKNYLSYFFFFPKATILCFSIKIFWVLLRLKHIWKRLEPNCLKTWYFCTLLINKIQWSKQSIKPFVKTKIKCFCNPPSSFFDWCKGPFPFGWTWKILRGKYEWCKSKEKPEKNNNRDLCFRIHSKSKQGTQSFSKGIPDRWYGIFKCLSKVAVTKKCIEYYNFAPSNWHVYRWKRQNWDKNTCLDTVRGWIVEFCYT